MPTYKDLCIDICLKMGEDKNIIGDTIIQTTTISGYLKAIPDLLREALNILATAGKYIISQIDITQDGTDIGVKRYDLKTLESDFYTISKVYFQSGDYYSSASNYTIEGGRYFTVRGDIAGTWKLYLNVYPQDIPRDITDNTEIRVDPEVYAILPLYIEGKLRLINDEDYTITVLSEFEQRRAELISNNRAFSATVERAGCNGYIPL